MLEILDWISAGLAPSGGSGRASDVIWGDRINVSFASVPDLNCPGGPVQRERGQLHQVGRAFSKTSVWRVGLRFAERRWFLWQETNIGFGGVRQGV